MELGLIGLCCVVMVAVGALVYITIAQSRALVKLSLNKGYHLIVTDPTGITQTVKVQDRVAEMEHAISEMREPTLSRQAEEFIHPAISGDPFPDFDGETREITRGE